MKEELEVTFDIPDRFVNLNDAGEYYIPGDFPYNKVVKFIKDFSMNYYGIDVDVKVDDLKPSQSKTIPSKWSITHRWIDEPNYEYANQLLDVVDTIGYVKGPTQLMLRPPVAAAWDVWKSDHDGLLKAYKEIYPKPRRMDIFKSMMKSVKNHIKMMK